MFKWALVAVVLWYLWDSSRPKGQEVFVKGASLPPDPPMY